MSGAARSEQASAFTSAPAQPPSPPHTIVSTRQMHPQMKLLGRLPDGPTVTTQSVINHPWPSCRGGAQRSRLPGADSVNGGRLSRYHFNLSRFQTKPAAPSQLLGPTSIHCPSRPPTVAAPPGLPSAASVPWLYNAPLRFDDLSNELRGPTPNEGRPRSSLPAPQLVLPPAHAAIQVQGFRLLFGSLEGTARDAGVAMTPCGHPRGQACVPNCELALGLSQQRRSQRAWHACSAAETRGTKCEWAKI